MEEASPRLSGQRLDTEDGSQKRGSKSPLTRSKSRSPSGSRSSTPSKVILAVSGLGCDGGKKKHFGEETTCDTFYINDPQAIFKLRRLPYAYDSNLTVTIVLLLETKLLLSFTMHVCEHTLLLVHKWIQRGTTTIGIVCFYFR